MPRGILCIISYNIDTRHIIKYAIIKIDLKGWKSGTKKVNIRLIIFCCQRENGNYLNCLTNKNQTRYKFDLDKRLF